MIPPAVVNWIAQQHRRFAALHGMGLVIKVGGSIQDDPAQMRGVMRDVAALVSMSARAVVIHGGGKAITAAMAKAGLQARFVQGQRYTDEATLRIAEEVLIGTVNKELLAYLEAEGCPARGLHSLDGCVLRAHRAGTDPSPGKPSEDLGLVGRVTTVNAQEIVSVCESGAVPVIAPIALEGGDENGQAGKLNVNADLAAGTVAASLGPDLFILISDTPGIRTDMAQPDWFAASLSKAEAGDLIATGVIAGGMLPKLAACFEALEGGTRRVCIIDGRQPGSLLAAALAAPGEQIAGTWVTA